MRPRSGILKEIACVNAYKNHRLKIFFVIHSGNICSGKKSHQVEKFENRISLSPSQKKKKKIIFHKFPRGLENCLGRGKKSDTIVEEPNPTFGRGKVRVIRDHVNGKHVYRLWRNFLASHILSYIRPLFVHERTILASRRVNTVILYEFEIQRHGSVTAHLLRKKQDAGCKTYTFPRHVIETIQSLHQTVYFTRFFSDNWCIKAANCL